MRFNRLRLPITSLFLGLCIVFGWAYYYGFDQGNVSKTAAVSGIIREAHHPLFWDALAFRRALVAAEKVPEREDVMGVIVPHHLLASHMIGETLAHVDPQGIERVVLLGPNHYEGGEDSVLTSLRDWETPRGLVEVEIDWIETLLDRFGDIKIDEEVARTEHSMGGLMPYIAHFFPDSKIVPIILSMRGKEEELKGLAMLLAEMDDGHTLYVASVDFSHYLTKEIADERDKATKILIENERRADIMDLNSEYMDSPASIYLLLTISKFLGGKPPVLVRQDNSGRIMGDPYGETTSYLTYIIPSIESNY